MDSALGLICGGTVFVLILVSAYGAKHNSPGPLGSGIPQDVISTDSSLTPEAISEIQAHDEYHAHAFPQAHPYDYRSTGFDSRYNPTQTMVCGSGAFHRMMSELAEELRSEVNGTDEGGWVRINGVDVMEGKEG